LPRVSEQMRASVAEGLCVELDACSPNDVSSSHQRAARSAEAAAASPRDARAA
jgi:hypothetical protein